MLQGTDGDGGRAAQIGRHVAINTHSGSYYCCDIIPAANEWATLGFSIRHVVALR